MQWAGSDIAVGGGDCFGGHVDEWITLINQVGKVVDLSYINVPFKRTLLQRRALETITIIAVKK